jgi:hypothetical protein
MDWTPFLKFAESAGSVMVAFVVLSVIIYLGHRFLYLPSQRITRAIAQSQADAANSAAEAAKAHQAAAESNRMAAEFNATTSESNARTAAHLERITDMFLDRMVGKPQS